MPAATKQPNKKPGTQYRYIGYHATTLESGAPLAPGDYVTLAEADMIGANRTLLDDGKLIDANNIVLTQEEEEASA